MHEIPHSEGVPEPLDHRETPDSLADPILDEYSGLDIADDTDPDIALPDGSNSFPAEGLDAASPAEQCEPEGVDPDEIPDARLSVVESKRPEVPDEDTVQLSETPKQKADPAPAAEVDERPEPREPLFEPIERGGREGRPFAEPGETLRAFGAPEGLAADVSALADQLGPLSALGPSKMPEDDQRRDFEGRGAYHDIHVDDKDLTVYVKGVGNTHAMTEDQPERDYPGYPDTTAEMIYGNIAQPDNDVEVKGALIAAGAYLEQIGAAGVLGPLAQENGWNTADEAIEAGATLPLGARELPGVSEHIGGLIDQYIEAGPNPAAREALRRWGKPSMATSALLVPPERRVTGGIDVGFAYQSHPSSVAVNRTIGQTLRTLAGAPGACYSEVSAHLQNFYAVEDPEKGKYAQADYYDLITLGAHGDRPIASELQAQFGTAATIPKETVRKALLFMPFERGSITPNYLPPAEPLPGDPVVEEDIEASQVAFWGGMLEGLASPAAIARIPELSPFMLKEIRIAAATLLYEAGDQEQWEAVAAQKEAYIDTIDPRYGVAEVYERDRAGAIKDETVAAFDRALRDEHLGVENMVAYLRTGDESHLQAHEVLQRKLRLQQAVAGIEDQAQRDELTRLFGDPDLQYCLKSDVHPESIMDEFSDALYTYMLENIEDGNAEETIRSAEILSLISKPRIRNQVAVGAGGEFVGHHYARSLLSCTSIHELNMLHDQARFDMHLQVLCFNLMPTPYRPTRPDATAPLEQRQAEAREALAQGSYNMNDYALANGLPPVEAVGKWIIGGAQRSPALAGDLSNLLVDYVYLLTEIRNPGWLNEDPSVLEPAYETLEDFLLDEPIILLLLPELMFMHDSFMAAQLAAVDPVRAQEHFDEAVRYYTEELPKRRHLGTVDPYSIGPSGSTEHAVWERIIYPDGTEGKPRPDWLANLVHYYETQLLPGIAADYRK
jgi:hypothetical protein